MTGFFLVYPPLTYPKGYEKLGFNVKDNGDVVYREWAPNALRAYLIGDFNNWDREATPMTKNDFGVFEVTVPGKDGKPVIPHDSKIKVCFSLHSNTPGS